MAIHVYLGGFHQPQIMTWRLPTPGAFVKQSGAVEACWAHNLEVRGSKPRSAKNVLFLTTANELSIRAKHTVKLSGV